METFAGIEITTERLVLRPLRLDDLEDYFAMLAIPENVAYWSHPPLQARSEAEKLLTRAMTAHREGKYMSLGIATRDMPQRLIGFVTLHQIFWQSKRGEVGYIVSRPYQGNGYAREAVRGLIAHAFREWDFIRIEADIHPDNAASRNLLVKLGFQQEGYMPQRWIVEGVISDSEVFGLLRANVPDF